MDSLNITADNFYVYTIEELKYKLNIGLINFNEIPDIINKSLSYQKYDYDLEVVKTIIDTLSPDLDYNVLDILYIFSDKINATIKTHSMLKYILNSTNVDIREKRYLCIRKAIYEEKMLFITTYLGYLRTHLSSKNEIIKALNILIQFTKTISEIKYDKSNSNKLNDILDYL
ncbi:MAG: hypothetical protein IKZ03_05090, partial [Clostridia bacterium]|nr:hypothetical protein [Clostridia bacterium]